MTNEDIRDIYRSIRSTESRLAAIEEQLKYIRESNKERIKNLFASITVSTGLALLILRITQMVIF